MPSRTIAITNASFEAENLSDGDWNESVIGWINTGDSGTFDPDSGDLDGSTVTGQNVAWL